MGYMFLFAAPEEISAAACDDKTDRMAMARHYNEVNINFHSYNKISSRVFCMRFLYFITMLKRLSRNYTLTSKVNRPIFRLDFAIHSVTKLKN